MARKKISLAFIQNNTNRKASFRKRRKGLIKKVMEISTLCDVPACAIIISPFDHKVEVWPSPEGVMAVLARYGATSGIHHHRRARKEMDQETFILQRIHKTQRKLGRMCNENKRSDLEKLMYRFMAGMDRVDNLDMPDRAEMGHSADQLLVEVNSKMAKLMMGPPGPPVAPSPLPPQSESFESYLMMTPTWMESSSRLDWDIGVLPYPF